MNGRDSLWLKILGMLSSLFHEVGVYLVHRLHVITLEGIHGILRFTEDGDDAGVVLLVVALLHEGGAVLETLHLVTDFRLGLALADDTFEVSCGTEVNLAEVAVYVAANGRV